MGARSCAEYIGGRVPDYQMSALLMAVFFRGLEPEELAALTDAMLDSGDRLRFDGYAGAPWSTSTRPAASATRSRCCSRRWWRAAAWRSR